MTTWRSGQQSLWKRFKTIKKPLTTFAKELADENLTIIAGCGVFFTENMDLTPTAFHQNVIFNHVIHEQTAIVTIRFTERPYEPAETSVKVSRISSRIYSVEAEVGFKERPNIPNLLSWARAQDLPAKDEFYYYISQVRVRPKRAFGEALWRKYFYALLTKVEEQPAEYYSLPPERVIEIGAQVEI